MDEPQRSVIVTITICGSLRFFDMMRGYVLNRPDTYLLPSPGDDNADWLHRQKIDRADKVLVFNVDGYIGPKTREEIEAANWYGKEIEYLEPLTAEKKEEGK